MAEQELRFSVILLYPDYTIRTTIFTLEEGNLCGGIFHPKNRIEAQFLKPVDEGDEDEGEVDFRYCRSSYFEGEVEGKKEFNLPGSGFHCHVEGSYFIVGGCLPRDYPKTRYRDPYGSSTFLISAPSSPRPAAGPWTVCGRLTEPGSIFVPVPYGGKMYLFGYPGQDVLIYDPRSRGYLPPVPMSESFDVFLCSSYFIWNQKIMLLYTCLTYDKLKLVSYDVGDGCWQDFDPDFRSNRDRNPLLLLPGTDTLLIMDQPDSWRVYDLAAREFTGETVRVEGLQDPYREVIASFCRASSSSSSRGCFLVFAFFMGFCEMGHFECPDEIAYAKISLTPPPKGEKKGMLRLLNHKAI